LDLAGRLRADLLFPPVSVRQSPVAHKLSLVGFWSHRVVLPLVGIHQLSIQPIADWSQTVAIITSMLLTIPVWTVLVISSVP